MIKQYRKKPVVIEAVQWDGTNMSEILMFAGEKAHVDYLDTAWEVGKGPVYALLSVQTLEGGLTASIGDYIIKGVKGEFYPCKPDVFEATYEEVSNEH
jgi:hypothetical protein